MKWDWNCKLPSDIFYRLQLDGYPGWHKPLLEIKINGFRYGSQRGSRLLSVHFDDVAKGQFWYMDFSDIPLFSLSEGDTYGSSFVFQLKDDYYSFLSDFLVPFIDDVNRDDENITYICFCDTK